ncbi:RING/U-box protein [Heracleum sosnowskyi]|uniref:RING/U-box protein n=1 Tax=Heracleum sosnowskyi TaxID=360622 RepID=A0AAD8JIT5_9APIA|nr:RING/U-box protein [Heracleum sosnowskyi]
MPHNSVPPNSQTLDSSQQDPQNSPNKIPKTLNSPSPNKGKSKIEDETSSCCGICLSEEGKSIRGCIDSCDHYFCFVCIMEWAKVESRCPMCKRRFRSIRRPVKEGVFATERIVNVPERNQVHHYFGNVPNGPQDQYAEVQCTVCHSTSDECLLLLCDLCDSASHTFCVGLGGTVPEGDWFCQDCTVLRDEHARDDKDLDADGSGEVDANWGNQTSLRIHQKPFSVEAPVSVFDIVRESGPHGVERFSTNRSHLSSTHVRDDGIHIATANVEHSSQPQYPAERGRSQLEARTLRQCRNVHGRIRALRENWDKIRQGSLSFSSISTSNHGVYEVRNCTSQPNLSSCSNQQERPQKSSSSNVVPNTGTQDIDKAWKMMTVAKSIEKKKCTNNVNCTSNGLKRPLTNIRTSKESDIARSMVISSFKVGNKVNDGIKLGSNHRDCLVAKHNDKHKSHMNEKEKLCSVPNLERYPATHSTESSKLSTLKKAQCSVQVGKDLGNIANLPQKNSPGTFSNKNNKNHGSSTCRSTGSVAENCHIAKQDVHVSSSSCNLEEKTRVEKSRVDGKARVESDAKSEIQSLVKLNLKLISTDKKLDTNTFKEVARLATHSILGACGIEAQKPGAPTFQSSFCSHADRVRRSTLMPSSCRECFFVFVKDVVNTIMLEKRTSLDTPC